MSFKSDLQSNNASLQAILESVNNLPEASPMTEIDTCTLIIDDTSSLYKSYVSCTVLRNGEISAVCYNDFATAIQIDGVLCNSMVTVAGQSCFESLTNATPICNYFHQAHGATTYQITATKNGTATIHYTTNAKPPTE